MAKLIRIHEDIEERLDKYLQDILEDYSRNQIQQAIENEEILVNNLPTKSSYKLRENDELLINLIEEETTEIIPEDIPLDIIYEDNDIIVINKSNDMVVHPAYGNYSGTLVNALLHYTKDLSTLGGEDRPGIVHRLDKDTSGVLVVCKNNFSHEYLSKQFKEQTVLRKYVAITHGVINHNLGKIEAPIGRSKEDRKLMGVVEDGKNAITNFTVLDRFRNNTLVEVSLDTGRTHQIRVHFKYIGYPIVGDPQYGLRKDKSSNGQYLHAKTIGFNHPTTNEYMEFESPLPDYFTRYLENLKFK